MAVVVVGGVLGQDLPQHDDIGPPPSLRPSFQPGRADPNDRDDQGNVVNLLVCSSSWKYAVVGLVLFLVSVAVFYFRKVVWSLVSGIATKSTEAVIGRSQTI